MNQKDKHLRNISILHSLMDTGRIFNVKFVNIDFKFDNGILMEKSLFESKWTISPRSFNEIIEKEIILVKGDTEDEQTNINSRGSSR